MRVSRASIQYAWHIPSAMYDSYNLDRSFLRAVDDKVGSYGPESYVGWEQVLAYMPEFWTSRKQAKRLDKAHHQAPRVL